MNIQLRIYLKFVFFTGFLVSTISGNCQPIEIYGIANEGGNGFGTIYKLDSEGESFDIVHSFGVTNARSPGIIQFVEGINNKLYATLSQGGEHDEGVLIEFDPATKSISSNFEFYPPENGEYLQGALVTGPNGKLYGTASLGGSNNDGLIYEYDVLADSLKVLFEFTEATTGRFPSRTLSLAPNGKFYGFAGGGPSSLGLIFSYDPLNDIYNIEQTIPSTTRGQNQIGRMIEASNNQFYGIATLGGNHNNGVIYEYDYIQNVYNVLFHFNSATTGYSPNGHLVETDSLIFYGLTRKGGSSDKGTIFRYDAVKDSFSTCYEFTGGIDGGDPTVSLFQASNGLLYGTNINGGGDSWGVMFSFDPTTYNLVVEDYFDDEDSVGYNSNANLFEYQGKLYGMTQSGGTYGRGGIYNVNLSGGDITYEQNFYDLSEGAFPSSRLLRSRDGVFYGTTSWGGTNGVGSVYELEYGTDKYSHKASFTESMGIFPMGDLAQAPDGRVFGVTDNGGAHRDGTVFSYNPSTNTLSKLEDFYFETTGYYEKGGFIIGQDLKLYGVSSVGGVNGGGVIYRFDYNSNELKAMHSFDDEADSYRVPKGKLLPIESNKLLGTTAAGGPNDAGSIYSIDITSQIPHIEYDFDGGNLASYPTGGLTLHPNGNYYGMTRNGGVKNYGTIYKYDRGNKHLSIVHEFGVNDKDSKNPIGELSLATNGNLYGATQYGGDKGFGVVFEFDPTNEEYRIVKSFNWINGKRPYSFLVEVGGFIGIKDENDRIGFGSVRVYPNPGREIYNIKVDNKITGNLQIINSSSAVVYTSKISNEKNLQINLSHLIPGIYFLRIVSENNVSSSKIIHMP